ncbi:uncharacterized protein LOC129234636 [Uloborus diversus]|uniref:uncharacterized protein LOC129234636 n=1 Tax=Uloborus diversus TaxID=327109 RepID=UPI0024092465|nr:uncharacterized protein LOC129234636 [Uloborus diversus]
MGRLFLNIFFCFLILHISTQAIQLNGKSFFGTTEEEYDEKLSEFIREVLENFRDQMPEGIPDIGIPPIDPLVIPNIDEDINDRLALLSLRMSNLTITGIQQFRLELLKADLEKGFANFSLSLPKLSAEGYCYMDGKVLKIFPINSDGPFSINVTEVRMNGYGDLNVSTSGETRLHMNDLKLNLTFGQLKIEFKSLLGGGRWTEMLLNILTGFGRNLFYKFHEEAMEKLNDALLKLINKELDKGTLAELLDQIPMSVPKKMKTEFFLHRIKNV